MAPPLEILGSSHVSKIQLFHFSPNLSFQTIVSFFTQSFESIVSFFTQSFVSRPLYYFSPTHTFPDRCFTQNLAAARFEPPTSRFNTWWIRSQDHSVLLAKDHSFIIHYKNFWLKNWWNKAFLNWIEFSNPCTSTKFPIRPQLNNTDWIYTMLLLNHIRLLTPYVIFRKFL